MSEGTAVVRKQTLEEVLMVEADQENLVTAYKLARQVERQQMIREASTAMAKLSWGTALSDITRAAVCRWALEQDIDPLRHFDILGNNVYPNARYFYDKVASEGNLHHDEVVVIAPLVSIDFSKMPISPEHKDELKAQAHDINAERLYLQMAYGVPEAINTGGQRAAAVIVRLFWNDGSMSEGCNWAGRYGQKKGDPVGEEHPVKTATTRAFRKAAMKKVSVHKFAKGDDGAPITEVTAYIDADREERHNQPQLPTQASYVKPVEVAQLPPDTASTFKAVEAYSEEPEPAEDGAESTVSDAEATQETDQVVEDAEIRQEEIGLDD